MAHVYEVHTSDGQVRSAETPHHHDEHDNSTFAKHLLDVLKGTTAGILSNVIVNKFIYKGRR